MARRLNLPKEYVRCRLLKHSWDDYEPKEDELRGPRWGRRFSLQCTRCTTKRHDVFDSTGELSSRRYVYPEGYKLTKDETPTTQQLRLEVVAELRAQAKARTEAYKARGKKKTAAA